MKKDNIILGLFAGGLALATYLSSTAHAGLGGACPAFALLATAPALQKVANEAAGHKAAPDWQLKNLDVHLAAKGVCGQGARDRWGVA